jgi:TM2 domain-containing membrane protein YozV
VAGNFGFGLVFFLAAIPAFLVILVSIFSGNIALMVGCIGLGVIYLIILGLVQSALQSIYQAAVFLYARNGQVPAGFEAELLGNAMVRK